MRGRGLAAQQSRSSGRGCHCRRCRTQAVRAQYQWQEQGSCACGVPRPWGHTLRGNMMSDSQVWKPPSFAFLMSAAVQKMKVGALLFREASRGAGAWCMRPACCMGQQPCAHASGRWWGRAACVATRLAGWWAAWPPAMLAVAAPCVRMRRPRHAGAAGATRAAAGARAPCARRMHGAHARRRTRADAKLLKFVNVRKVVLHGLPLLHPVTRGGSGARAGRWREGGGALLTGRAAAGSPNAGRARGVFLLQRAPPSCRSARALLRAPCDAPLTRSGWRLPPPPWCCCGVRGASVERLLASAPPLGARSSARVLIAPTGPSYEAEDGDAGSWREVAEGPAARTGGAKERKQHKYECTVHADATYKAFGSACAG